MRAAILLATLALVAVPTAHAGGPGMLIGATEDATKSTTMAVAKAQMDLLVAAGFSADRVTEEWAPGETTLPATGKQVLENLATAAKLDGVTIICVVMSHGSATTPLTPEDQQDFASYAASIARAIPSFQIFVIGNEPNLNRYWLPQYNDDGSDAAAPAYETLLAGAYDALKEVSPAITVLGGALAPRGGDAPSTVRPTHNPTVFIHDMGQAWVDSGRTTPIMDGFDMHPYEDNSSIAPIAGAHPNSTTIALADYDKLVAALGDAFGDYALPIWYDEFGVETQIPAQWETQYTGTEPTTIHPVSEVTQGAYYRQAIQLAFCQPNVRALMLFHTIDESEHAAWQSGLYYADSTTAKASLAPTRLAMQEARRGVVTHCDGLELSVTPRVSQKATRLTLSCTLDCRYSAQLYRGTRRVAGVTGRAIGGQAKLLSLRVPTTAGFYRVRLTGYNPVNPAPEKVRWVTLRRG
jgi:polysaccharide biosynthesis protein PslG